MDRSSRTMTPLVVIESESLMASRAPSVGMHGCMPVVWVWGQLTSGLVPTDGAHFYFSVGSRAGHFHRGLKTI